MESVFELEMHYQSKSNIIDHLVCDLWGNSKAIDVNFMIVFGFFGYLKCA
jgi:hypothetical protein